MKVTFTRILYIDRFVTIKRNKIIFSKNREESAEDDTTDLSTKKQREEKIAEDRILFIDNAMF